MIAELMLIRTIPSQEYILEWSREQQVLGQRHDLSLPFNPTPDRDKTCTRTRSRQNRAGLHQAGLR